MKSTSEIAFKRAVSWLRAGRVWGCILVLAVLAGSCLTFREAPSRGAGPSDATRGFKFSHKLHKENGLDDCTVCHDPTAAEPNALTQPAHELCATCHDVPTTENNNPPTDPAERAKCSFCHLREDFTVTRWKPSLSTELKWQHAPHLNAQLDCVKCHTGTSEAKMRPALSMASCIECHKQQPKPGMAECTECHTQINRDTVPQFRDGQRIAHDAPLVWKKIHGQESKLNPAYCANCHEKKESCNECHTKEAPADHTLAWRGKPHGLQAQWNRNRCATCHEEDSCVKCHKSDTPSSHRAGWGEPADRHCVTCHFPAQQNECVVCHDKIDHEQAKPSPHAFGVFPPNCAQCHPGRIPYLAPHPLNSTVKCVQCHR